MPVYLPKCDEKPVISIVIPVFNQWRYTNACLRALAAAWDPAFPTEVIVVDDASADETAGLLSRCTGIRVVRREINGGFAAAANDGAGITRGEYLYFLNNDAFVTEGAIRELLSTFLLDARIAAAVSQQRYPGDKLAEAGGIIWRNGSGSNYGRGDRPGRSQYTYVRDVDYGSSASLMVRANAFAEVGSFSTAFTPAYYEDVDLCFSLRDRAYRVVYQPRSIVYHVEGMSYGSNVQRDAISLQERSRLVFVEKWKDTLGQHLPPDLRRIESAARRLCGRATIVVVDEHVPFADRDAGSRRILGIMHLLRARGFHVLFGSVDPNEYPPYTQRLEDAGIETVAGFTPRSLHALRRSNLEVRVAWLCRPGPARRLIDEFRSVFPAATIVFDTVDLHYLRLQREQSSRGGNTHWEAMRDQEYTLASSSDLTLVTNPVEAETLRSRTSKPVAVVTVIESGSTVEPPGWGDRRDVLFVGNYGHAPNVDAAEWLCREIMPRVWEKAPDLRLTLAGADPTHSVRRLAGNNVLVTGYADDLSELLAKHRVFAAPLRFGAGIKGKVVQALANGLPVVATPIGAEGIFASLEGGLIAEDTDAIARAILKLNEDTCLWERLSHDAQTIAGRFSPAAVQAQIDRVLETLGL